MVGELSAGIALGPTLLGHYFPHAFAAIFPADKQQFHLLDAFGTVGMSLLLLLTGLETDLRLLRNLGRAALIASVMGMVLPFGLGFGLGYFMPAEYLADPNSRMLFSLFLATAMSISAMPVIAKILIDLDLTKRNIGLVILSAGVVDDTVGWLILSLIAAAATHGVVHIQDLGPHGRSTWRSSSSSTIFVLYPILRVAVRVATEHFKASDSDLVLVIVTTFLCAAATERIGVHPVFGAFVAGHRPSPDAAPAQGDDRAPRVGHVRRAGADLLRHRRPARRTSGRWAAARCWASSSLVACVGKLVGCSLGAYWGGLRFWEAASIAVAMNARGAMEIVVATIGLSLGILTPQMFSIIVMVAIVTSFLAPVGLRLTMPRVRMTEDEARRILASESTGAFDPARVRVLLATGGGDERAGRGAAGLRAGAQEQRRGEDRARRGASGPGGGGCSQRRHFSGSATEQIEHDARAGRRRAAAGGRAGERRQHRARDLRRGASAAATSSCSGRARGRRSAAPVVEQVVARGAVPRRDHEGAGARRPTTSASWSPSTAASPRAWRSSWRCATRRRRAPSWRWPC